MGFYLEACGQCRRGAGTWNSGGTCAAGEPFQSMRAHDACGRTVHITNKQTNKHTNKQTNQHTNKQTHKPTHKQTNKRTNKQTNKHTNTRANKQTNKQTHKQTNKQTHRQTKKQTAPGLESESATLLSFDMPKSLHLQGFGFADARNRVTVAF